jgi:hypothetical protein
VLGAACPAPGRRPAPPQEARDSVAVDGLLFTGTTRVWGAGADSIAVAVRLTNRRAVPLAYGYGACVLDPRLVRPGGTPDRPAYAWSARPESSLVRRSDGSLGAVYWGCPMYLAMGRLAPGASDAPSEFAWREGLDSVRADSLRGPYRVVARLRLLGRAFDVPAGAIRLP